MKIAAFVIVLFVILVTITFLAIDFWRGLSDVEISLNGMIAMTLGIAFSFAIGGGLMWLVFYSNRRGHDDDVF